MSRRRDARDALAALAMNETVVSPAPEPEKVVGVVTSEGTRGLVEAPVVTDAGNAEALQSAVTRDEEVRELAAAYSKPQLKKMADEENATYSRRGSASHIAREILENRDTMNRESGILEGAEDPTPDVL